MRLVLDAEAVQALVDPGHSARAHVRQSLTAAERLERDVVVPAVVLAGLYRGRSRSSGVDAALARTEVDVVDTDRGLARNVGGLLHQADMGSEHLVDAHVVACALPTGGVVLTGDARDCERLAAGLVHVQVVALRPG